MNTVLKTFVESVIELLIGGVALVKYSVWQISRFFFFIYLPFTLVTYTSDQINVRYTMCILN